MGLWPSKFKTITEKYDSFCSEISNRLGEPRNINAKNKNVDEAIRGLLNDLSPAFARMFVIHSDGEWSSVVAMGAVTGSATTRRVRRLVPRFNSEADLRPCALDYSGFTKNIEFDGLFSNPLAFHFWLDPEFEISLVVICDEEDVAARRELLTKTRNLIQERFYE